MGGHVVIRWQDLDPKPTAREQGVLYRQCKRRAWFIDGKCEGMVASLADDRAHRVCLVCDDYAEYGRDARML